MGEKSAIFRKEGGLCSHYLTTCEVGSPTIQSVLTFAERLAEENFSEEASRSCRINPKTVILFRQSEVTNHSSSTHF